MTAPGPEVHAATASSCCRSARPDDGRQQRHRPCSAGRPTWSVDDAANELYIADGYGNRRVIVFDAETGAYKRHWGAYGNKPDDDKLPAYDPASAAVASSSATRCTACAVEGRPRLRVRPRQQPHPGVPEGRHVREGEVPGERARSADGSAWDIDFWPDAKPDLPVRRRRREQRSYGSCERRRRRGGRQLRPHGRTPASSTGCTTSPSIPRATSTRPRSTPASARRSSRQTGCRSSSSVHPEMVVQPVERGQPQLN